MTIQTNQFNEQPINVMDIVQLVINEKILIFLITLIIGIGSIIYALSLEREYVAETLVKSASQTQAASSSVSGMAALFGIQTPTGSFGAKNDLDTAISVMSSRIFLEKYISDNKLMPILFDSDWNEKTNSWDTNEAPTVIDGYNVLRNSMSMSFDPSVWGGRRQLGFVIIQVTWKDPLVASMIANSLIKDINQYLGNQSLEETKKSIAFIEEQLQKTNVLAVKEVLYSLLTEQLRNLVLANTQEEFALKVLDNAIPPKFPSGTSKAITVITFTIVGFILSLLFVLLKIKVFPLVKQLKFL